MLLAAMLAMVLAAAAPALSQTAAGGDVAVLQYSCNQIQAAVATQYQAGEGTGAVAGAAQSLGIDQQQVLACFGTAAALQDSTVNVGGDNGTAKAKKATAKAAKATAKAAKATAKAAKATAKATASPTAKATASPTATATATAPAALPPTGGASVIALSAIVLLVAGGLLARRIVR
jgi:hypothetical protein